MPFAKGQSGNPGGRPKETADVRILARQYSAEAIKGLASIARDKKQPGTARAQAWNSLLDRGFGRPAQAIEHSGEIDLRGKTDDELHAELAANLAVIAAGAPDLRGVGETEEDEPAG